MSLQRILRLIWFYTGLSILTFGFALIIRSGIGAGPWDIFHLGLTLQSGLSLGLIMQLTGLAIILLNLTLQIRPTLGMLLNMLSVGPMVQFFLSRLPLPSPLAGRWLLLLAGIALGGFGTALYVSADLGSGPRDGLMIGLTRRFRLPVAVVKNGIDITVAFTGWMLGGPLGAGTAVVALSLGPSVQLGMYLVQHLARLPLLAGFVRPVVLKR